MFIQMIGRHIKLIISLVIVFGSIFYLQELKLYYDSLTNQGTSSQINDEREDIFSESKLGLFNGVTNNKLYLAVLGVVFDVSEGKRHYGDGGSYSYFERMALEVWSRETLKMSDNKDHVIDLTCNDLFTLLHWRDTFKQKYIEVGVLTGRFYDKYGEKTPYAMEFNHKIKQCEAEKENAKKEDQKYPPCNVAWSADEGTKVWCTKSSGGVTRSWAGVPRQLYAPGVEKPRCVCVNLQEQDQYDGLIKAYSNCQETSNTCFLNNI